MTDEEYYAWLDTLESIVGTGPWRISKDPSGRVARLEAWQGVEREGEPTIYTYVRIGDA